MFTITFMELELKNIIILSKNEIKINLNLDVTKILFVNK